VETGQRPQNGSCASIALLMCPASLTDGLCYARVEDQGVCDQELFRKRRSGRSIAAGYIERESLLSFRAVSRARCHLWSASVTDDVFPASSMEIEAWAFGALRHFLISSGMASGVNSHCASVLDR
jgi:hypothetical protein